jgi:hypothetical protein
MTVFVDIVIDAIAGMLSGHDSLWQWILFSMPSLACCLDMTGFFSSLALAHSTQ